MTDFTLLPVELRQRILLMTLSDADKYSNPWIDTFRSLILVNKQFLADVRNVAITWTPLYTIFKPHPHQWPSTQPRSPLCVLPHPSAICIELFHMLKISSFFSTSPYSRSHEPDQLLSEWKAQISRLLPPNTRTVLVDATPTSGYVRRKKPTWLSTTVDDDRTTRHFMPWYRQSVADVVKEIFHCTGPKTSIVLTGTYSERNRAWVDSIVLECVSKGITFQSEANFVRKPLAKLRDKTLYFETGRLTPDRRHLGSTHENRVRACARVRYTRYRQTTEGLFTNCFEDNRCWAQGVLEKFVYYFSDKRGDHLDLQASNSMQRKFIHYMAADLGLKTETIHRGATEQVVRLSEGTRTPYSVV